VRVRHCSRETAEMQMRCVCVTHVRVCAAAFVCRRLLPFEARSGRAPCGAPQVVQFGCEVARSGGTPHTVPSLPLHSVPSATHTADRVALCALQVGRARSRTRWRKGETRGCTCSHHTHTRPTGASLATPCGGGLPRAASAHTARTAVHGLTTLHSARLTKLCTSVHTSHCGVCCIVCAAGGPAFPAQPARPRRRLVPTPHPSS
jgi:hypothetical protein